MNNCRAYPTQNFEYDGQGNVIHWQYEGMTLLDHFAGLAMQACLARGDDSNRPGIAEWSYSMAEAMLKERAKYEQV
jgi:hypothetical protein